MQTKFLKLFLLLLINSTIAGAQSIFMEATGASQGKFEGEVTQKGREKTSYVANYEFMASTAATAKGGSSSANRVLTITKEFDLMSLNFYKALVTNENINQVTLNLFFPNRINSPTGTGMEVLGLKIELTDVMVASYKQTGKGEGTAANNKPVDEIKLIYKSLKITHTGKNFVVEDK